MSQRERDRIRSKQHSLKGNTKASREAAATPHPRRREVCAGADAKFLGKKTPAIKGRSQAFTRECTGNRTLFQTAINSQILLLDDNHRVPVVTLASSRIHVSSRLTQRRNKTTTSLPLSRAFSTCYSCRRRSVQYASAQTCCCSVNNATKKKAESTKKMYTVIILFKK